MRSAPQPPGSAGGEYDKALRGLGKGRDLVVHGALVVAMDGVDSRLLVS